MYVDATETRHIQHRLRQDQPVGNHHHHVGVEFGHRALVLFGAQRFGLKDRQLVLFSQHFDRAWRQLIAAARRAVGLGKTPTIWCSDDNSASR